VLKGMVDVRKLKIALLVVSTAVSLFSLRDKATVTTVPDTNPPVAEAYHAPAWMQPQPVSAQNLIMPSTIVRNPPQIPDRSALYSEFAEPELFTQESYIVGSGPANTADANIALAAPAESPATGAASPAASEPATIIYGYTGLDPFLGTNNKETVPAKGGTSYQQQAPEPEKPQPKSLTESSIFVTSLTPDSGIPGTSIVMQGAGFDSTASNNIVKFGTVSSASVTYVSANQLRATVPPSGVSAGFTNVSVTTNSVVSNNALFSVLKSSPGNIFEDDTQDLLPSGLTLTDSSIVRSGDADNDSDQDILVVNISAGAAYLLINDGHGVFASAAASSLPSIPDPSLITDVVFGDVNKDGFSDIILAYSSGQSARLLMNDGLGKFNDRTAANLPAVSGSAASIDLGDYNNDGAPDIVVANKNARDVMLVNNGTGTFSIDANFDLPGVIDGSSDIRFCDINGDGSLDIVTTNNDIVGASSLRNRVYINDGQGQFTDGTASLLPEDGEYSEVLDCGDIDGDGDIDIIVANDDQNAVLINNGSGVFEDQTTDRIPTNDFASKDTKLGDMNGDGHPDIVMLGNEKMSLLMNDGQGSFKEGSIKLPDYKSIPAILGGKSIQIADIDGDGSLDIVIGGDSLRVLMNRPSNKAPVLAPIGNKTVASGASLTFNISAEDPNGDELTLLAEGLPGAATFLSPVFSWTPTSANIGQHSNIRFIARENTLAALEDSEAITITVTGSGLPVIDYRVPDSLDLDLAMGQIAQFGIHATDPDGRALTFKWFLNGVEIPSGSGATSSIIFIVPRIGGNTVEAKVSNSFGTTSLLWNLDVGITQNQPPSITSYSPNQQTVNVDLSAGAGFSFGVTATDPDLDILSYTWKFNNAVLPSSGANLSSSAFMGSVGIAGDYPLEVSVSDGHNAAVTHSWTIHVTQGGAVNHAPVAVSDSVTVNINTTTDVDVLANDSDVDGNALSISATGLTQPSHGSAAIVGNKVRYIPASGYTGSDTFTYKATDGSLESASATVSVTVEEPVTEQLIKRSFSYFWDQTDNPETGFTRDRVAVKSEDRNSTFDVHYNRASLSATGFQLAALCAADNDPAIAGGVTHEQLEARATLIMDKLLEIQSNQDPADQATWAKWGRDGFFYHFVDIDTGERYPGSEVSTIDTAIVVAGAVTAGNHFGGVLKDKALDIYSQVNWKAFLDTNPIVLNHHDAANPSYNHLYHAWDPETVENGGFYGHWDYTNECLILYLLAAASPANNYAVPAEVLYTVRRELGNYGPDGNPMVKSWDGALFLYQYTQAFFNFKDASGSPLYDKQGVDWWNNSVEATRANKQFCNDFINRFAGQEDLWGLTAGYTDGFTYGVYGALPAGKTIADPDGTVFPSAVTGSLPFLPDEVTRALNKMKELYDDYSYPVWGDYGFVNSFKLGDSLNDAPSPVSTFYCGIDVGITLVMAENRKSGLIWDSFSGFEIAPGVTLKSRIQQIAGLTTDATCRLAVDDISDVSSFHMGKIDAVSTRYQVKFDLSAVQDAPYLLSVHSFMDTGLPSHVVNVAVKVNNADPFTVEFAYNSGGKNPDLMKYITIDSADLAAGENTITLEWQGATANAKWLAWKNIEISTPAENNLWSFARNETLNPKALFGSEYRVDDTYFVGADISSFEQAVNKDVEGFTDILFYTTTGTAEHASLTLKALETQNDANTNVRIFVNSAPEPVFDGSFTTSGQITTPSFQLASGWNRITIYHPGVTGAAPGEWIRWDSVSLAAANPSKFNPPQGLSAASLGPDKVNLRWQVVSGIDVRYNIYRSQASAGPYTKMNGAALTSPQYQDAALANGASYYYAVTAYAASDLTTESDRSAAVLKTTGAYDVDYRDGRDPNSFGGISSPQSTYSKEYRHDWSDGAVRKVTLNPQESAWIGLANINVGQANALSIWIRGTGAEKIDVGLQNTGSGASTFAVTASAGWQNLKIKLSDFSGVSPANLDKLSIKNTSSQMVTVFLDDISFVNDSAGTAVLNVAAKNVSDNSLSTGMSFANDNVNSYAPANQYLAVNYDSPGAMNWKIWIYTKNDNGDPQYLGGQYNGLMSSDGRSRVALIWRIYPAVQPGGVACRTTPDVYNGSNMTWNYIKDRNDSDWVTANPAGAEYSVTAFGRKNEWAYIAPVPPGLGNRTPAGNTFYVYLGGEFGSANPGDYSARIYFDITHE
jgi:hypothetical protein